MQSKKYAAPLLLTIILLLAGIVNTGTADTMPTALYIGYAAQNTSIRTTMSRDADALGRIDVGEPAYITAYYPGWLEVVYGNEESWGTGYVLRHTVFDITALYSNILPYGATPAVYTCTVTRDAGLYESADASSEQINLISAGTKVAVLSIENGWARVIHWRQDGYFYLDAATDLTPVYDKNTAKSGDTLAAFVSFFSQSTDGLNPNRLVNIDVACDYISLTLQPGEEFGFNAIAGPYRKTRGYLEAPAFVGGETVASYGGGTCQVSSTLYNVLLPLKDDIAILYRVAHGPGGAKYLPHGVDAACGNTGIDLQFRNDYPFPVRIEASAHYGVLYIALVKA